VSYSSVVALGSTSKGGRVYLQGKWMLRAGTPQRRLTASRGEIRHWVKESVLLLAKGQL
jgi:hypothetical protein